MSYNNLEVLEKYLKLYPLDGDNLILEFIIRTRCDSKNPSSDDINYSEAIEIFNWFSHNRFTPDIQRILNKYRKTIEANEERLNKQFEKVGPPTLFTAAGISRPSGLHDSDQKELS